MNNKKGILFGALTISIISIVFLVSWIFGKQGTILPWVILLTLLATLGVLYGVRRYWVLKQGIKFRHAIDKQVNDVAQTLEIESMQAKMDESLNKLKTSSLGYSGNSALYALPWFLIIGSSGVGKSTLLRHSGLNFPLSTGESADVKGVAGTRNCDWWFADKAVILDTAGRYTNDVDQKEWRTFLKLCSSYRKQDSFNGIILAISVEEIIEQNSSNLKEYVERLRQRLLEIVNDLGYIIPIYVVFTKCDLCEGFVDFFGNISKENRDQVWGVYLGEESKFGVATYREGFKSLNEQLNNNLINNIATKNDIKNKLKLLRFSDNFKRMLVSLEEFLDDLFMTNNYQEGLLFNGIYFTSGMKQLNNAKKNNRDSESRYYNEKPKEEDTNGFFINDFFSKVLFENVPRLKLSARSVKNNSYKNIAFACISTVLIIIFMANMYDVLDDNVDLLRQGEEKVFIASESKFHLDTQAGYQQLDSIYTHYENLLAYEGNKPISWSFGTYKGNKQKEIYEEIIDEWIYNEVFIEVISSMISELNSVYNQWNTQSDLWRTENYHYYYDLLKSYSIIIGNNKLLSNQEYMYRILLPFWNDILKKRSWSSNIMIGGDSSLSSRLLKQSLKYLSKESMHKDKLLNNIKIDVNDLHQMQQQLRPPKDADQLYEMLKRQWLAYKYPYGVRELLIESNDILYTDQTVPYAYTRDGWNNQIKKEISTWARKVYEGDWVLNDNSNLSSEKIDESDDISLMVQTLRGYYFADYSDIWLDWVASIKIKSFNSIQDASNKLNLLAQNPGPLTSLMSEVYNQITPSEYDVLNSNLTSKFKTGLNNQAKKLAIGSDGLSGSIDKYNLVSELELPFNGLIRFTESSDSIDISELMHQYLILLREIQVELSQVASSSNPEKDSSVLAEHILSNNGKSELYKSYLNIQLILRGLDSKTMASLEPLLLAPIHHSWETILNSTEKYLNKEWNNIVYSAYENELQGRFPLYSKGVDASLEDFVRFFQPKTGAMVRFKDNVLEPYVDFNSYNNSFVAKSWLGRSINFSKGFRQSIQKSELITESLFESHTGQLGMSFSMYPISNPDLAEMTFESNDDAYRYTHGPHIWEDFNWPGKMGQVGAKIIIMKPYTPSKQYVESGVWGLFRLLNQGDVISEGNAQYLLSWKLRAADGDDVMVQYRMRANKQRNGFNPKLFNNFQLPEKIS